MGQEGNDKPLKHGSYINLYKRKLDFRTRIGKAVLHLQDMLTRDLLTAPTMGQQILIGRAAHKTVTLHYIEIQLSREPGNSTADRLLKHYIGLSNSLRADLQLLRIEPRMKDYVSYLDEVGNKQDAAGEAIDKESDAVDRGN